MKLRNKKGLVLGIVALSAVAITSVGFAAWVISQGDEKTADGTILVDSVNDNRHVITLGTPSAAQIKYGTPATMNAAEEWLTNEGGFVEVLEFTVSLSVTNVENVTNVSAITASSPVNLAFEAKKNGTTESSASDNGFLKAASESLVGTKKADNSYVNELPSVANTGISFSNLSSEVNTTGDTSLYTVSYDITVKFAWGSAFSNQNPYNYYNDGTKTASSHGDEAATRLGNLNTYLTGVTYLLTASIAA